MLYQLRKRGGDAAKLDEASTLMFASKNNEAEAILASVSRELGKQVIDGGYHLTSELLYREEKDISAAENQRCRLDVYAPAMKKAFSTVIWFHGGGLTCRVSAPSRSRCGLKGSPWWPRTTASGLA